MEFKIKQQGLFNGKYIIFILVFSYSNLIGKSSTNKYRITWY